MNTTKILKNYLTIFVFIVCMGFLACSKDNDDKGNYYMKAKIDGNSWSSHKEQLAAVVQGEYLFISGATANEHELITINFIDFPGGTGVFPMGTGQYSFICFYTIGNVSYHVFDDVHISSGVLEITSMKANTLKGKFSFTGVTPNEDATVQVTDGNFSLPFFSGN